MKWYSSNCCEFPWNRPASDAGPSSVSKRYSLSMRTQGNSCRRRASSSLRRVSSFSSLRSCSRCSSHSSCVAIRCCVVALVDILLPPEFLELCDQCAPGCEEEPSDHQERCGGAMRAHVRQASYFVGRGVAMPAACTTGTYSALNRV